MSSAWDADSLNDVEWLRNHKPGYTGYTTPFTDAQTKQYFRITSLYGARTQIARNSMKRLYKWAGVRYPFGDFNLSERIMGPLESELRIKQTVSPMMRRQA